MTAPVLHAESRLALVELSIVAQGEAFVVGNAVQGNFVQLPPIGVAAIERLRAGESIAEVSAALSTDDSEEDVDVLDFAGTLLELGFVAAVDGASVSRPEPDEPVRGWIRGPRPERIRWLFGRTAWTVYALLFAGCIAVMALAPRYLPHAGDFFFLDDPLASIAIVTVISFVTVGGHECFHWLAGSAAGIAARFAISRRLYFLVFETDLTQLWSLPRRLRYGPLLAGMAFDTVVLSLTLATRLLIDAGVVTAPPVVARLLAAVAVLITTNLVWQFCVFLRNDLYLVVSALLGCVNLWRIAMLQIKRVLWRLTPGERAEFDDGDEHSRRHARWYSWLCVAGVIGAGWYAADVLAPTIWRLLLSLRDHLTGLPLTSPQYWEAVAFGVLAFLPLVLTGYVLIRDARRARRRTISG